jgi:hypothetical protein
MELPQMPTDTQIGTDETIIHLAWHTQAGEKGTDKYIARYTAFLTENRSETGEPAVWSIDHVHPIDDRACHQQLTGRIERTVYYDNPRRSETELDKKRSSTTTVSISAAGTGPGISNFFRAQNCGDMQAEFDTNLNNAKIYIQQTFPAFVAQNRAALVADLIRDYKQEVVAAETNA